MITVSSTSPRRRNATTRMRARGIVTSPPTRYRSKVKRAASMLGLIVLMVIRLAGSASAECGWVLWQHTTPVEPPVAPLGKVRLSTHASKRECEQEGRELVQAAVAQGDNHPSLNGLCVRMATGVNVTYRCRPDPCTQRGGHVLDPQPSELAR